jgi:uncharacterized membrane protein YedE/YeeE
MSFDPDRLPYPVRRLLYRTAMLLGVALLAGAGIEAGMSLRLLRSGERQVGEVVNLGGPSDRLFLKVARADGQTTLFRANRLTGASAGVYIPVLFDNSRPGAPPVAATPAALWLAPGLMMVFGGVLFGFGFRPRERGGGGR